MATPKPQPKQPRRPILFIVKGPVPDDMVAVLRFSYFRQGRPRCVEEHSLFDEEGALQLLQMALDTALGQGADVSLITPYEPEELGLENFMPA